MPVVFGTIAAIFGMILLAVLLTVVLVPVFRAVGWIVRHVFAFVGGEIGDALRLVGATITAAVFSLLVVANILIFRWSASAHFGRAFSAELGAGGASIYRILVGHPARFLGLRSLVDGIERRVPDAVAAAPTADKPSRRTGQFENYRIIGSLAGGGSGGKLYIAEPDDMKLAAFTRNGQHGVEQVVIKTFSLRDGSSLPQIVRESRALDAAKKLGLVLDHELTPERFFYVMRYVPGESLGLVTQHLHAASREGGLSGGNLHKALGYIEHLLATLRRYHEGGLWHKDVKPDNIIIHGQEAHLVDFGLITPLRSAMTLTTHGTEYFRDPEMVRMALKGVKVHEVDGARFDVYAAGAVLYSLVENSFPAHGGLSQITKRCPDALRWIIRRAMTDYDKRYASAAAMLADLAHLRRAADPFAVKPAELPSVRGGEDAPVEPMVEVAHEEFSFVPPRGLGVPVGAGVPGAAAAYGAGAAVAVASPRVKPRIRLANWWSGRYALDADGPEAAALRRSAGPARRAARVAPDVRRPAAEQLRSARARAEERRARARERLSAHRHAGGAYGRHGGRHGGRREGRRHASGINAGVAVSLFLFLGFCVGLAGLIITRGMEQRDRAASELAQATMDGFNVAISGGEGSRAGLGMGAAPAAVVTPPLPPAPRLEGRVLVVSDLLPPLDAQVNSVLQGVFGAMQNAGLEVVGTLPSLGLDESEEAFVAESIAEVKTLRGLRPLDSDEVYEAMSDWLDEEHEADVLVWIEPSPERDSLPAVKIFPSSEVLEEAPPDYLASIERLFSVRG
ncbi:MAG TPA: hypothetical protein VFF69_14420 [Phycisphaerales bacterium]|nr:hypothetical protein [Phycisphaerales bacterium]